VNFGEKECRTVCFPYFIVNGLPVGITGLLIASIFAAGMSTISTSLNSGATVILNDFYRPYKEQVTERESVSVLYIASAGICVLGVLISFYIIRVESALDIWWNLAGIFSGGMLGLFLLGYFSRKGSQCTGSHRGGPGLACDCLDEPVTGLLSAAGWNPFRIRNAQLFNHSGGNPGDIFNRIPAVH
jgi:Na+/proline symporter